MNICFEAPRSKEQSCPLQLRVDTLTKEVEKGYCLTMWKDRIKLKSKQELYKLYQECVDAGYITK